MSENFDAAKTIKLLSNIGKVGVAGCLSVALYWMNGRLNKAEQRYEYLEARLFECLASRSHIEPIETPSTQTPERISAAVLPDQRRKLYYYETIN